MSGAARALRWRGLDPDHFEDICGGRQGCGGSGVKQYPTTAGWRSNLGGQAITYDTCNRCWGSGSARNPWTNMRELRDTVLALQARLRAAGIK